MADTFSSINQPQGGGVPQFSQTSPVVGNSGEAVVALANIGANIFGQMGAAKAKREQGAAQSASDTAIGSLQQGLLNIRQAAATDSSIDATRQSRLLLTKFNQDHPELRTEATKAYKAETGNTPSGLDEVEEAKLKLQTEAISAGFGSYKASKEYNDEQLELYQNIKRKDKMNSSEILDASRRVQEGTAHKSELKTAVLSSFQSIASDYTKKTGSDMSEMITQWQAGGVTTEEAMLNIRATRSKINREIATLGEYATDPAVNAYTRPTLDNLQLAEDKISGKIEQAAINANISLNKARASSIFMSDPENVNLVVASEAFNYTAGVQPRVTKAVLSFLTGGLGKDGMPSTKTKPVDPLRLDEEERGTVKEVVKGMLGDKGTKESKAEAANTVAGVAEHLSRNGMDYDPEDKKFAIDILNTKGAMESLSPEQRGTVMIALDMYVTDTVDKDVRNLVTNPAQLSTSSAPFPRVMGGSGPDMKNLVDAADIKVVDGRIYWTVKRQFAGDVKIQRQIREINKGIEENITPAVTVYSKGLGMSFENTATMFFSPEAEAQEAPVGK